MNTFFFFCDENTVSKITGNYRKNMIYAHIYMYLYFNVFNNQARVKYD